ncbi:MAG: transglycosylase domain-containing protein [Armatimonadetes bacterium]|nr:transglycosylase domain-containing protein [Armatimonadota bacterium]
MGCVAGWLLFISEFHKAQDEVNAFYDVREQMQVPPSEIISADGKLLYQVSAERRDYKTLAEIPVVVQHAVLAAEDRRFYQHAGVDPWALLRIMFTGLKEGHATQGGSTLTMQLAKRISSKGERTLTRKIHDMALATAVEQQFSKDQVLELYLNQVYFGAHAYGIAAAADVYFGKDLSELTPSDAAILARCVRRPSFENPFVNLPKSIENRNVVLRTMKEEGYLSQKDYEKALAEKPKLRDKPSDTVRIYRYPYFTSHVLQFLHREHPNIHLEDGGYRIETTLDTGMQEAAEQEVKQFVREHRGQKVTTAAMVLMNADGEILTEVGGASFERNQFNVVSQGRRQPGSSFKPFVYATAFATGKLNSLDDTLSNEKVVYPAEAGRAVYAPKNSNGKYGGSVTVRTAIAYSINIPAVRVGEMVGPGTVVDYAQNVFGFVSPMHAVLSLPLGTNDVNMLEMAQGYSTFMLNGDRATPMIVRKITQITDGEVIADYSPRIFRKILDPRVAGIIDEALRGVVEHGTATYAEGLVPNARGKTGTTQNNTDAWFCGYANGIVGISWIANEHPRKGRTPSYLPMDREVYGGTVTVRLWAAVMKKAIERYGNKFVSVHVDNERKNRDAKDAPSAIPKTTETDPSLGPDEVPLGPTDDAAPLQPGDTPPAQPPTKSDGTDDASPNDVPTVPVNRNPSVAADSGAKDKDQYVEVEVCADSGLKANVYCPETVVRRFKKGTEPKRTCNIHKGGG